MPQETLGDAIDQCLNTMGCSDNSDELDKR